MEKDVVGNVTIERGEVYYVIMREEPTVGVEGLFKDKDVAVKALRIVKKDKPNWDFSIREYKLIIDIYEQD